MFEKFDRPVRCSAGHLWGSLKAVRLGRRRYQRCPVGRHWAIVTPVDRSVAAAELAVAATVHDVRVP